VAEQLDPEALFGHRGGFDDVTVSYCLSMVDDAERAVRAAFRCLAPAGTLHVVDFGDMAGLPGWFRRGMVAWLRRFGVRHRPEVEATLRALAGVGVRVETAEIGRRYALLHRLGRRGLGGDPRAAGV
jgi:S-adenosylmethionine-diacylgycerolhomoserine-N-methlytransferase